jgi:hypothetical protein
MQSFHHTALKCTVQAQCILGCANFTHITSIGVQWHKLLWRLSKRWLSWDLLTRGLF